MKRVLLAVSLAVALAVGGLGVSGVMAETMATKDWTIMVFLNADNNLDSFGVSDMNEMEKIGSSSRVNIIVQIDREHGPAKRYYIKKDSSGSVTSPVIQELGEVNMGDHNELVKFVEWAAKKYPARRYMLDVWNHGAGWKLRYDTPIYRGVSYDDHPWGYITTREMGDACKRIKRILGKNLDILGYDCCLMQMASVAYQVMGCVDYHVASEETEPGDGWRYDTWLKHVVRKPSMSAGDLASKIVKEYTSSYSFIFSVTQSSVKPRDLRYMGQKIEKLVKLLKTAPSEAEAIASALKSVQKFYDKDYVDLYHLMDLLEKNMKLAVLRNAVKDIKYTKGVVVHEESHKGFGVKNAQGLSIYFPVASRYRRDYENLEFAKDSKWHEFLKSFYDARLSDSYRRMVALKAEKLSEETDRDTLERIAFMENETREYVQEKLAKKLMAGEFEALNELLDYAASLDNDEAIVLRPALDTARELLTNAALDTSDALERSGLLKNLMKVTDQLRK